MNGDPTMPWGIPVSVDETSTDTDRLSFEDFYASEYHSVLALSRVLTGDLSRAEDITHGSFVAALETWETIDDPSLWIRSVVTDKAPSRWRVRDAEQRVTDVQSHTLRIGPDLPAETEDYWRAVRDLPRTQAQAVAMVHLEDRSVADLSLILASSESTARALLVKGRRALTRRLDIRPAIDIDTYGRRHGEVVKESLEYFNPPPIDDLRGWSSKSTNPRPWILAAAAVAGIAVFGVLAFSGGIGEPMEPETGPVPTIETPPSTSTPETTAVRVGSRPFEMNWFMTSRVDEIFGDFSPHVSVFALVQSYWLFEFEKIAWSAPMLELAGYRIVPAAHVAEVAAEFAEWRDSDPLEGVWFAVGLEPKYFDSPTETWLDDLAAAPGAVVLGVNNSEGALSVPKGWEVVADLPTDIPGFAEVVGVDEGIVVISGDATTLIRPDGTWVEGQPPPPESALGMHFSDIEIVSAGDVVVATGADLGATWIFDTGDLTWREVEPRPLRGYASGSAFVDGQLVVVGATEHSIGDSLVLALDLESGIWTERHPLPDGLEAASVMTDGSTIYVAGIVHDGSSGIVRRLSPKVFASIAGGGWTELPEIPIDRQGLSIGWTDGLGPVALNHDFQSAVLDEASSEWRLVEAAPFDYELCNPQTHRVAHGVVAICRAVAWFDPETEAWTGFRPTLNGKYAVLSDQVLGLVQTREGITQLISLPLP